MALAPDSWWKRLGAGEAQRLPAGNVTGVVRLTSSSSAAWARTAS